MTPYFLPRQTHERLFHLEAILHQSQELETFCHYHSLEQLHLQPVMPCRKHSADRGSYNEVRLAVQDYLLNKDTV